MDQQLRRRRERWKRRDKNNARPGWPSRTRRAAENARVPINVSFIVPEIRGIASKCGLLIARCIAGPRDFIVVFTSRATTGSRPGYNLNFNRPLASPQNGANYETLRKTGRQKRRNITGVAVSGAINAGTAPYPGPKIIVIVANLTV